MSWRTAYALDEYRAEVDRRFPNRSKASDGTIGDNAHAGQGSYSDHNPWIIGPGGVGVVRAFDLTHDPRNGVDCAILSDHLFELGKAGDARLRNGGYLIFNNWITNADWQAWRRYDGSNPHTSHMHVSFSTDYYDRRGPWAAAFGLAAPPKGNPVDKLDQLLRVGVAILDQLGGPGVGQAVADGRPAKFDGYTQGGGRSLYNLAAATAAAVDVPGAVDVRK